MVENVFGTTPPAGGGFGSTFGESEYKITTRGPGGYFKVFLGGNGGGGGNRTRVYEKCWHITETVTIAGVTTCTNKKSNPPRCETTMTIKKEVECGKGCPGSNEIRNPRYCGFKPCKYDGEEIETTEGITFKYIMPFTTCTEEEGPVGSCPALEPKEYVITHPCCPTLADLKWAFNNAGWIKNPNARDRLLQWKPIMDNHVKKNSGFTLHNMCMWNYVVMGGDFATVVADEVTRTVPGARPGQKKVVKPDRPRKMSDLRNGDLLEGCDCVDPAAKALHCCSIGMMTYPSEPLPSTKFKRKGKFPCKLTRPSWWDSPAYSNTRPMDKFFDGLNRFCP